MLIEAKLLADGGGVGLPAQKRQKKLTPSVLLSIKPTSFMRSGQKVALSLLAADPKVKDQTDGVWQCAGCPRLMGNFLGFMLVLFYGVFFLYICMATLFFVV
jgi:hypothetical protein